MKIRGSDFVAANSSSPSLPEVTGAAGVLLWKNPVGFIYFYLFIYFHVPAGVPDGFPESVQYTAGSERVK